MSMLKAYTFTLRRKKATSWSWPHLTCLNGSTTLLVALKVCVCGLAFCCADVLPLEPKGDTKPLCKLFVDSHLWLDKYLMLWPVNIPTLAKLLPRSKNCTALSNETDRSKLKRVDSLTTSKALVVFFSHWQFCGLNYWPCFLHREDHSHHCTEEHALPIGAHFVLSVYSQGANTVWHPPPTPLLPSSPRLISCEYLLWGSLRSAW